MLNQKHLKIAAIAAGVSFLGACATVETTDTAAKTTATTVTTAKVSETETDGSRRICKSTTVVGSKFRKKVCATADEWAARQQEDQKTTEDIQRSGANPGVTN